MQPEHDWTGDSAGREDRRNTSLKETAKAFAQLTAGLHETTPGSTLKAVLDRGSAQIVGARWASVTLLRRGRFSTPVASDETAVRIDDLQYEVGSGPCVDAVLEDTHFVTGDIAYEPRWQPLGARLQEQFGLHSMLAYRLHLLNEDEAIAGLNFSSDRPDAFSEEDVDRGMLFATHCALLVTATLAETRAQNLVKALRSNRQIGVAMGVLMARHHLTADQAFDTLRMASQNTNRRMAEIALDVAETGEMPDRVINHGRG